MNMTSGKKQAGIFSKSQKKALIIVFPKAKKALLFSIFVIHLFRSWNIHHDHFTQNKKMMRMFHLTHKS